MFALENTGYIAGVGRSFEVVTRANTFAGMICESFKSNTCKVYFDSNCSKGSARKFPSVQSAVDFIHSRRVKKGWRV